MVLLTNIGLPFASKKDSISITWLDAYCYTVRQSITIYYKSLEASG